MNEDYITSRDSYGILITPDALLYRKWFKEFTRLQGVNVLHKYPLKDKTYTINGEVVATYSSPTPVGCIFEEHPTPKTTRRLGWSTELSEESSIIHLPYDLEGLQLGSLVIIPSPIDKSKGRVFRIKRMSAVSLIYPWAISCELIPEYENKLDKAQLSYEKSNFNLTHFEEDN